MSSLIFLIHSCVVLFVPFFFGWVVLRRIVREHDWLVLIPGSVIVGAAALMTLMNELRYWLEMSLATWFTYKLMLIAAFLLLITCRPPRPPRLAVSRSQLGWLGLAWLGAAISAVYFGLPTARGLLHDAWWFHYPAATLVQDLARFPLPAVFAHDDPLHYHFGPDILAATWSHLLNQPVAFGFMFNVVLFAPATFLLAYALVLRASRSHPGALAAAIFLLVGGNLLFLGLPATQLSHPLRIMETLNSQSVDGLLKLMLTPSHCLGIPMVLVGLAMIRHFWLRPSWPLAGMLGLWLGTLTLVAEWYFFPLAAVLAVLSFWPAFRHGRGRPLPLWLRLVPFAVAAAVGLFNNTYVAGIFGHFWVDSTTITSEAANRIRRHQLAWSTERKADHPTSTTNKASRVEQHSSAPPTQINIPEPKTSFDVYSFTTTPPPAAPPWSPPPLIPLRLNLTHLGQVPSWSEARSKESGFIPVWHPRFLAECTPILTLGLPFGLWLAWRRRHLLANLLVLLTIISLVPPVFLDWGYRSADFLRFFTGAFSFSALLLGWLVGHWWAKYRLLAIGVTACCLVNPLILGWLGSNRATFDKLRDISERAGSLQEAAKATDLSSSRLPVTDTSLNTSIRGGVSQPEALKELSEHARRYLYPLTQGRERAVVIVPPEQIPPTKVFPEWMKLATLMRVQLPVGWHWSDSVYAAHYRRAATTLDRESIAALDARWIIVTNLFGPPPGDSIMQALGNRKQFLPCAVYHSGQYYLAVVRVLTEGM